MKMKQNPLYTKIKILTSLSLLLGTSTAFPINFKQGHPVIQLGGFVSSAGKAQHINIQNLIGDDFSVTSGSDLNGLVGLGYLIDTPESGLFKMSYGINAFYLAKTAVSGNVTKEQQFTNLSYNYNVSHVPVFAVAKSTINLHSDRYALTVEAGLGPNFITTRNFQENSLDGGITIPDNVFSGKTTTTLGATIGIGMKVNNVFGTTPLECGYHFFYLGRGNFNSLTNQLLNTLTTWNNYANAMVCSVTF